jgi:N-carbamoylputrescine amidase
MESANNRVAENLARAAQWVDAAARGKAELVLLPELFSTGYDVNANIWRAAEPEGGATEAWLGATGRRHGIHVGGSYLEHHEGRYFNTFALAGPSGEMVGRVRKEHPCSFEAYIFEGGDGLHIIDTALGRIGIAICYDAFFRAVWDGILTGAADVVLIPMSAPTPSETLFYGRKRIDAFLASFSGLAVEMALATGMPVALANKWGPWETTPPGTLPRLLWSRMKTQFPGFTHLADSDGREVARVPQGEGVASATVQLDPARKQQAMGADKDRYRPWVVKVPSEYGAFHYFETWGRRWYEKHASLRQLAPSQPPLP